MGRDLWLRCHCASKMLDNPVVDTQLNQIICEMKSSNVNGIKHIVICKKCNLTKDENLKR